jgi:hypothetical protein
VTRDEAAWPGWARADWLALGLVWLAACLPYLRTVPDYFIQDDFGVVQLLARKPWTTFPQWFAMPWMEDIWGYTPDEIRPFPALSYQITALWGQAVPHGHHLLNIALHAINGSLVFAVARAAAGLSIAGALVSAIVFVLLPADAESVAWITGRVDSMPTLFYLASFLTYVEWRRSGSRRRYIWSLVWFFLALFSKQNTITMVATLAAYDLLVGRRTVRLSWTWLKPYVPFAIMTAMFLGLRYLVLGEVLRENQLSAQWMAGFGAVVARHLQRIAVGHLGGVPAAAWAGAAVFGVIALASAMVSDAGTRSRALRSVMYFGPVWLAIGLAPALAAGYESPRHAYLAAVGWGLLIGIAFDVIYRPGAQNTHPAIGRWSRRVAVLGAALIAGAYTWQLHGVVADWSRRAAVSKLAVEVLEREASTAARGTLVLMDVPVPSWEWAVPFTARPPYTAADLTRRVHIVTPRLLNCCRDPHWEAATRKTLEAWAHVPDQPILAIAVDDSGEVRRLTGAADPDLVLLAKLLREIPSPHSLDAAIVDILRTLVAGRGERIHAGTPSPR